MGTNIEQKEMTDNNVIPFAPLVTDEQIEYAHDILDDIFNILAAEYDEAILLTRDGDHLNVDKMGLTDFEVMQWLEHGLDFISETI